MKKSPNNQNWLGREGLQLINTVTNKRKKNATMQKDFSV